MSKKPQSAKALANLAANLQAEPEDGKPGGPIQSFASYLWEAYKQMHKRGRDEAQAFTGFDGIEPPKC